MAREAILKQDDSGDSVARPAADLPEADDDRDLRPQRMCDMIGQREVKV